MSIINGWVKLHRSLLDWEWYTTQNTKDVFIHLLLTANINDGKYMGFMVKRGQLITKLSQIAHETGLTIQSVRTAVNHLKSTHEITIKSTNKFSLITIVKYEFFQCSDTETNTQSNTLPNNQLTFNQQTTNIQSTRLVEEEKEEEEFKKNKNKEYIGVQSPPTTTTKFSKPSLEEIETYCKERNNGINAQYFIDYYTANGWRVGKNPMKCWKAAIRTWEKNSKNNNEEPKNEHTTRQYGTTF